MNVTCDECVPVTEEFPANSSLYTTELVNHFLNDKAYDLTIQTENSVGLSEKTLQVHIPALDNGKYVYWHHLQIKFALTKSFV